MVIVNNKEQEISCYVVKVTGLRAESEATPSKEQEISCYVVIEHEGDCARLECDSLEEAVQVRRSFVNWGGYQSVEIDIKDP